MTLSGQISEIHERIERTGIGLKDALSVIDMTFEDQLSRLDASSPYEAFSGLNELIGKTARGVKVGRSRPKDEARRFHTIEIYSEEGDVLGHLKMLYLKRVVPCYYLVYVEVMSSFRGLGLGNRILTAFMEFLQKKKAVGLLDNIIPPEDPTNEIYTRLGWKVLADLVGERFSDGWGNYMVFIPDSVKPRDLERYLIQLLFNLKKRRSVIDMHDNEDMVRRTIEEFRAVYDALVQLFNEELVTGTSNLLMRFMFTRLTTKLLGFRRRIARLIGYTGGESLEQISFENRIKDLYIQPYSVWHLEEEDAGIWGDEGILRTMPTDLKDEPTFFIEALPLYRRPYLKGWTGTARPGAPHLLKISDVLDLGFDPTRLREFHHGGVDYIFERISPLFASALIKKRTFLRKIERSLSGLRVRGAAIETNPILLIFRNRGNVYVLRRQVKGIHSEEALDQLRTVPSLKSMNSAVGADRLLISTINDVTDWLNKRFHADFKQEIEELAYFVPWDIENNIPGISVDISGVALDRLWIA